MSDYWREAYYDNPHYYIGPHRSYRRPMHDIADVSQNKNKICLMPKFKFKTFANALYNLHFLK